MRLLVPLFSSLSWAAGIEERVTRWGLFSRRGAHLFFIQRIRCSNCWVLSRTFSLGFQHLLVTSCQVILTGLITNCGKMVQVMNTNIESSTEAFHRPYVVLGGY